MDTRRSRPAEAGGSGRGHIRQLCCRNEVAAAARSQLRFQRQSAAPSRLGGASIRNSLVSDGCVIESGAVIEVEEEKPEKDMKREKKQERKQQHKP